MINDSLLQNPTFVNLDPFSQRCMIKIQLTNVSEIENLMNYQDYKAKTLFFIFSSFILIFITINHDFHYTVKLVSVQNNYIILSQVLNQ